MVDRAGVAQSTENNNLRCQTPGSGSTVFKGFCSGLSNLESLSPALTRPLHITRFDNPFARTKRDVERSLVEISNAISRRVAASKGGLPLIKLGRFGSVASVKGSLRHNANMHLVEGWKAITTRAR